MALDSTISWTTKRLGEIASVTRGASPRPIASPRWFNDSSDVGWVRIADLGRSDGLTLRTTTQRLSPDGIARSRYLPPGTLIMSIAATVGVPIVTGIPACIHDGFVAIQNPRGIDQTYLLYALKALQSELRSAGQTGSQSNINTDIVNGLQVPLPPFAEQQAIAAALIDVDKLIGTIERQIAKKQAIKQGMIQQLLTGKTRLPGFAGLWQDARLGDVLVVRHGKSQKAVEAASGAYPILATGGQIGRTNTPLYSKPSVLIGRKGTIDRPQFQATPFWTVDTLFYTEVSASADPKFLYYVFTTIDWRSLNEASGVPSLSRSRVENVPVALPEIKEQRAIREVLDDADSELEVLRSRLNKATDMKQGMMRELLAGRTRLPVTETAS
jgi:type I restriction enzyme S subunit